MPKGVYERTLENRPHPRVEKVCPTCGKINLKLRASKGFCNQKCCSKRIISNEERQKRFEIMNRLEVKTKISKANKGKVRSDEVREKMSIQRKGIPKSEEHKKKIGDSNRGIKRPYAGKNLPHGYGEKNSFYGKHHTEEFKEKKRKQTTEYWAKRGPKKFTKPELQLFEILDNLNIQYTKHSSLLGITIPDAFDKENKIVFYADGDYWHNLPEYKIRDERINKTLLENKYIVLRFWETELRENANDITNRISYIYERGREIA